MVYSRRAGAIVCAVFAILATMLNLASANNMVIRSRRRSSHITVNANTMETSQQQQQQNQQQEQSEVEQEESRDDEKYILVRTVIGQAMEFKSKAIAIAKTKTRTPPPPDGIYVNKPVLRGQFHKWGAILFMPLFGMPLCLKAWQCNASNTSTITPCLLRTSLLFCFGFQLISTISGTLHTYRWKTEKNHQIARKMDFMGIFVGMACFYSSIGRIVFGEHPYWKTIEKTVWTCAILGSALKWKVPDMPHWVNASIFLVQGWATLPVVPYLLFSDKISTTTMISMVGGGLFVTLGALAYALQWPYNKENKQPFEIIFGPHEVFHVGSLLSILSFWITMWTRISELSTN